VVHHDRRLNPDIARTPDGQPVVAPGPLIRSLSLAQLQQFDVGQLRPGSRYASQYPEQQPAPGARIPRLQQVLDLVLGSGSRDVRLAIETKLSPLAPEESPAPEDFARLLVQALQQAGLARRSSVLSFDWRTLAVVQRLAPEIDTVYLSAQQRWLDNIGAGAAQPSPWTAGLRHDEHGSVARMVKAAGGHSWSAYFGDLDAGKVREAQALGLKVLAWTVNLPADINRMLDWGVDGIVSDRPDLVREAMHRRGLALPKPVLVSPP
jgi:glycerophosphoryl diester phosphodiesterase